MKNTKYFEKWAEGKQPTVAMFAYSMVFHSKIAFKITKLIHEEDMFLGEFAAPDLDTWLKLFRSHPHGTNFMNSLVGDLNGFMQSANELVDQLDKSSSLKKTDIPFNEADRLYEKFIKTLNVTEKELMQVTQIDELLKFLLSPEFYFFFRIYIPCQLYYHTTPAQLFRKARLRNFDSLIKLIKIDPSVIFDKRISHYIHELRSTRRSRYEQIIDTLHFKTRGKITKQKFKLYYAALIMQMSIDFGEKLTAPEIRDLFDAVAQDEGKGLVDPDLPDTPHTFYMAIKRHLTNDK